MKKLTTKVLMLLCLINVLTTQRTISAPTNKRTMLKGYITVNGSDNHEIPKLSIIFNGTHAISNSDGFFAFPITQHKTDVYKLVIAKTLDQNFQNANTIEDVSIPEGKRSRIITLNCQGSEDGSFMCESEVCTEQSDGSLSCQAEKPSKANSISTHNSIIILIDPEMIERIENWHHTVKLADNFVQLPRIVLKNRSKKELSTASAESLLYALDIKPFHEPIAGKKRHLTAGKIKQAILP